MHITLSDGHNTFISLDVDPAETIENVKALLSAEVYTLLKVDQFPI